jgi:biopolymer transport protein ExbD
MAGSSLYQDEGASSISDINVTPLVDVTLVLLIIFMVTAKLIVARGIDVESPKTASGDEIKSTLQVTIDKQRKLYINGEPYQDTALMRARVEELARGKPEMKAIVTADTTVPYGDVMQVVDLVKLAGVTKFGMATDALAPGEATLLDTPPAGPEGAPPPQQAPPLEAPQGAPQEAP